MQTAEFFVQINQTRRNARQTTITLISCVRGVQGFGHGLYERGKAALGVALFRQGIERLFRHHDLFVGLCADFNLCGAVRDVFADLDQLAAHGEVMDQLRIVPCRKGRDCRARKFDEVGRAAQFLQTSIILEVGFQRNRRGERVHRNPRFCGFEDAAVHWIVEVIFGDHGCDFVKDFVVRQDRAEKLLLSLNRMRDWVFCCRFDPCCVECCKFVHCYCTQTALKPDPSVIANSAVKGKMYNPVDGLWVSLVDTLSGWGENSDTHIWIEKGRQETAAL